MNLMRTAQDKWVQPGWKIEQKYANKVLLGNWAEERLQFTQEPRTSDRTDRVDHRPRWDSPPDVFERRSASLRAEGLPAKLLFAHNGPPSSHYSVSHYEESYQRKRTDTRPWQPGSLTWQGESFDQPISAAPTDAGPRRSTKCLEERRSHLPPLTAYRSAYQRPPLAAFCQNRFARAPRSLSSHLHPGNRINKDLDLRGRSLLQIPDGC